MKRATSIAIGLVLVLYAASAAWAQGTITLKSVAEVEQQVLNEEGQKVVKRMPAAKVLPGSEVIFTTTYENTGDKAADKAFITNPIPQHMVYVADSAQGMGTLITFSIDGGKTFDIPARLFVFDAAGRKFPARIQDYTHIRWTFENPLPSGAKGSVSFRAVLE
jgi:uncharacterized repeat protein (TIGR01451 family)